MRKFRRTMNVVLKAYIGHSFSSITRAVMMTGIDSCMFFYLFYPWLKNHGLPEIPRIDTPLDVFLGMCVLRYSLYAILPARFRS